MPINFLRLELTRICIKFLYHILLVCFNKYKSFEKGIPDFYSSLGIVQIIPYQTITIFFKSH